MNIIADNPFRILGLCSNTNERDIERNSSILKRYNEIGKPKDFPLDLFFLGNINRDNESLHVSLGKIEHPKHRIGCGIFWFFNLSHVDAVAFKHPTLAPVQSDHS